MPSFASTTGTVLVRISEQTAGAHGLWVEPECWVLTARGSARRQKPHRAAGEMSEPPGTCLSECGWWDVNGGMFGQKKFPGITQNTAAPAGAGKSLHPGFIHEHSKSGRPAGQPQRKTCLNFKAWTQGKLGARTEIWVFIWIEDGGWMLKNLFFLVTWGFVCPCWHKLSCSSHLPGTGDF